MMLIASLRIPGSNLSRVGHAGWEGKAFYEEDCLRASTKNYKSGQTCLGITSYPK